VQVLFGLLLGLPCTARFDRLAPWQRQLYVLTLLLATLSIVLLTGPVPCHRLVFRHRTPRLVVVANAMALGGLGVVALALSSAVTLAVGAVDHGAAVPVIAGVTAAAFTPTWFLLPAADRRRPP